MNIDPKKGFKFGIELKLKDKDYINSLFKSGSKKVQNNLIVFYNPSDSFKFLVSFKKRLLNPVKRNRFKRIVREFIRLNQYKLKNIYCAVLIRKVPSSDAMFFKELEFLLK